MNRNAIAAGLTGIVAVAYLGFIVYSAIAGPSRPKTSASTESLAAARQIGDATTFALAKRWDKLTLVGLVDPRVQKQPWFEDLVTQLPDLKIQFGTVANVKSQLRRVSGETGKDELFDYQADVVFEHESGKVRQLIAKTGAGWRIVAIEVRASTIDVDSIPKDEDRVPENPSPIGNM